MAEPVSPLHAAVALDLSVSYVYRLINEGQIRSVPGPRGKLIPADALDEYRQAQAELPAQRRELAAARAAWREWAKRELDESGVEPPAPEFLARVAQVLRTVA
jgi:excisionase family DNA binding protein